MADNLCLKFTEKLDASSIFITGLNNDSNDRTLRSGDGKAAVWAGAIDDLWKLGKPRGKGGPWKNTKVDANKPSDPYLMTGFDRKSVTLEADTDCAITLEVDIDGTGLWVPFKTFELTKGEATTFDFPAGFSAYWVRAKSNQACKATAQFVYE